MFDLTPEEQEFEDALTKESFAKINDPYYVEQKKKAIQYAKNTLKRKQVTIRPFASDIEAIKEESIKLWIPYQNLITWLIHQFATGRISIKFSQNE